MKKTMPAVWQPTTTLNTLQIRATIVANIRRFFMERNVLEVDTHLLSHATVTDPYIIGIPAFFKEMSSTVEKTLYLQTSPEYAMKRLLAAGAGSIYQICKAFRQGEIGRVHNPEFTILEWYRLGFDHHALMDEVDVFLQSVLAVEPAERISYATVFENFVGVNPHSASTAELVNCTHKHNLAFGSLVITDNADRNTWLDLLMTHCVEPQVGRERPIFIYDFPQSQAALAKIRYEDPVVASRFEVYFKGLELANGFHELQDSFEQAQRFEKDLIFRAQQGIPTVTVDERFLAALQHGIPDCAGVALGVDRLVMLATNAESIREVLSFAIDQA